jgi:RNA polymerase sigma-70 factor (ECF subfamily)
MPPMPTWYQGRDAVVVFLKEWAFAKPWQGTRFVPGDRTVRLVPARANGQLAFGAYRWVEEKGAYLPYTIQMLSLRGAQITEITGFVTPDAFRHFDLPAELAP